MEKTIFTPEFYQKVYDCIMDGIDDMDDGANYFECVIGDVTVSASVMVDVTEEDRSFSHAFGIQREFGYVREFSDIDDVEVWDEDGDAVEGFSVDEFNEQFMVDETAIPGGTVRKGDAVSVPGYGRPEVGEFVGYDTIRGIYTVIVNGKERNVSHIKVA